MTRQGKVRANKTVSKQNRKTNKKLNKSTHKQHKTWKQKSKVGRIVLKNLPFKATKENIQEFLLKYGDLREVKLLQREDGSPVGCGFAQFTRKESAEKAIKECNNSQFMGRKINVDWAVPKAEYILKISSNDDTTFHSHGQSMGSISHENEQFDADQCEDDRSQNKKKLKKEKKNYINQAQTAHSTSVQNHVLPHQVALDEIGKTDIPKRVKQETRSSESENDEHNTNSEVKTENSSTLPKPTKMKKKTEKRPKKKGRLIVRNLSFKVTEDILREHFSTYGEIAEINLLKKPDGKLVGCAFIQFERVQSAAKAILGSSGKPLLGRIVVIDWAVPHKKYVDATKNEESVVIKEEEIEEETKPDIKNKITPQETVKVESDSESGFESDKVVKEVSTSDESEDDAESITEEEPEKFKKPRVISNDVMEGCTVFVKNVPFSATNDELRTCMEQFGTVVYALICVDPLTEHSKGTAFVKFKEKESAEECLKAGTELTLNEQILDVFRALSRDEIQQKINKKKDPVKKDGRNLYLVKEGVVLAGTPAAAGVSVADMSRRLQLEKWKSQILRNLNMFISPKRLVVHNIPPSWTDTQLRKLFQKHGGEGTVITEARIMKNMRNIDADGNGTSKEYGFVSFTTHEAALQALRNINNNPSIFTPTKRPIVSFSVENRAILKAKQQRLERSRANNLRDMRPPRNHRRTEHVKKEAYQDQQHKHEAKKGKRRPNSNESNNKKKRKLENSKPTDNTAEVNEYVGVISKPGNVKLRTKFSLKKQAVIHAKHVKQNKKKEKLKQMRFKQHITQEPIKQPKQKQNSRRKHKEEDKTLNKLISTYKSKLNSAADFKKWYE